MRYRNMSQKEFAKKTGIAESSISDWKEACKRSLWDIWKH